MSIPKSAYEIAVENGYKGSEQEWFEKLEIGYGNGKVLAELPIKQLTRLYNSGTMRAPLKEDGTYDLETMNYIRHRIMRGY